MDEKLNLSFSGIYQVLNLVNGKRYVGQAKNIALRIYEHKRGRSNDYLQRAFKKYGWENMAVSVLEKIEVEYLDEREQFWLDALQCYDNSVGYNICEIAGTTRGQKHSQETINKIKASLPCRLGENNAFYGKRHTPEVRTKLSDLAKSRKISEETKDKLKKARAVNKAGRPQHPVSQIDLGTGEIIATWESVKAVHEGMNISKALISECCHEKKKSAKGYGWKFQQ